MWTDSTNLNAPDLGPGFPTYPGLEELIRPTGIVGTFPGTSLFAYSGFVQQWTPPLVLRDRIACYLLEPNGVALGPGIYDSRLVGSYLGLPLFATTCCLTGGFGSSSSPSSSSSLFSTGFVERVSLGFTRGTGVSSISLGPVTLFAGDLLVVVAAVLGSGVSANATFGGSSLGRDDEISLPGGAAVAGTLNVLSGRFAGTGNIVVSTVGLATASLTLQAVQVTGLAVGVLDRSASASGLLGAPDTGSLTTTAANEYAQGAFVLLSPGAGWDWVNGFESGDQDLSQQVGLTPASVTEGYRILTAAGTVDAALGSVTPAAWAGLLATYR